MFYDILERKNLFLGYKKIQVQKLKKIETIPKEVNPWFGQKMAIFPTSFLVIQTRKMSFMIFQNEKTPIQAIKTRSSKSPNIDIFPKGLTHGFGPKMTIFSTFFLGNISQENVFYDILEQKNVFLAYKNKKFKKSKN